MTTDRFTVNAVVVGLILLGLAVVASATVLTLNDKTVSDALWGLAGTAVGALGALLARTTTNDDPTPVNIVGQPIDVEPPARTTVRKKAAKKSPAK